MAEENVNQSSRMASVSSAGRRKLMRAACCVLTLIGDHSGLLAAICDVVDDTSRYYASYRICQQFQSFNIEVDQSRDTPQLQPCRVWDAGFEQVFRIGYCSRSHGEAANMEGSTE